MEANYFTILYWFCHTSTWIHHGRTCVPHPEHPSHLPPRTIPPGHPSAPAPRLLYRTWTGDSFLIWYYTCFHAIPPNHPTLSNQSWIFIRRTDAKAEALILWLSWWEESTHWKRPELGKIEGRRRRGQQRTRWLDGITDSTDMNLRKLQEMVKTEQPDVLQSMGLQRIRHDWVTGQHNKADQEIETARLQVTSILRDRAVPLKWGRQLMEICLTNRKWDV